MIAEVLALLSVFGFRLWRGVLLASFRDLRCAARNRAGEKGKGGVSGGGALSRWRRWTVDVDTGVSEVSLSLKGEESCGGGTV